MKVIGSIKGLPGKWDRFWFGPQPLRPLCIFRVITGLLLLYYMADKLIEFREFLTPQGYHLPHEALEYPPIVDIPPLSEQLAVYVVVGFLALATLFTVGLYARIVTPLLFCLFFYLTMIDLLSAFTINQVFLMTLLFLSFVPCAEYYSVDAWRNRAAKQPRQFVEGWVIRVFQFTLVSSYLVAGLCKALPFKGDWLKHSDVLMSHMSGIYQTKFAFWMLHNIPEWGWVGIQYSALAFELFAIILFTVPRLRLIGITIGVGFHLMIAATMYLLLPFSLQFISFYVFFLPAEWFVKD